MDSISEKQERLMRGQRPLYERIQDRIFSHASGQGVNIFRIGLFGLLVGGVILIYTGTQFFGLREKEAMDAGQLGRNMALGRGYVTRFIRPLDLSYLKSIGKPTLGPQQMTVPELWTPPVYPTVLAVALRATGTAKEGVAPDGIRQDRVVMLTGWFFFITGLAMTYMLARAVFDQRVGVLSALLYLFCNPLLDDAVSGMPTGIVATLLLAAAYALLKAERWQKAGGAAWKVDAALAVSALAIGLGTLTQYAMGMMMLPLLVYVGTTFQSARWRRWAVVLGVFGLVMMPWMARNRAVSQTLFGLTKHGLMEEVGQGRNRVEEGQLQRVYGVESPWRLGTLIQKSLVNMRSLYETGVKDIGAGYVMAFFVASLLRRWREEEMLRLRRWWWAGLVACGLWLCVAGQGGRNFFTVFAPLVLIYGAAFFVVLFERLEFRTRFLRTGMLVLFVGVNMVPMGLAILPPRKTMPYPPYSSGVGAELGGMFRGEELLASDIPWAVAWYADRSTLWMPGRQVDFIEINDRVWVIAGVYLTQGMLMERTVLDEWSGRDQFVLRLYQSPVPAGFPLQNYRTLAPDGEHVLLSSRPL